MIAVPDATHVAERRRGRCAPRTRAITSGGKPCGNVGNGAIEHDARHLPVTGHRVLAGRAPRPCVRTRAERSTGAGDGHRLTRDQARAEPQRRQRQADGARRCCRACRCPRRRMQRGIGQLADADTVENDEDRRAGAAAIGRGPAPAARPAQRLIVATSSSSRSRGERIVAMACLKTM